MHSTFPTGGQPLEPLRVQVVTSRLFFFGGFIPASRSVWECLGCSDCRRPPEA
ncbi:hypothetical protein LZ30DRAFT_740732 [Colletotrichum cereale]|nr:hypothetical protein LZ30DRAFT_740732 [Colletotrichum cereale]